MIKEDKAIWALYDKLGSKVAVADALGVDESTVRRRIKKLKKEYGEPKKAVTPKPVHVTKKEGQQMTADFLTTLRETVGKGEAIKPFPPKKQDGETLVVELTDWHIGSKDADSSGKARYNTEIASTRAVDMCRKVLSLTKQHVMEGTIIDQIDVFVVGDMVDGDDMFPSQIAEIEFQPPKQVMKFVDIFRNFLLGLKDFKLPINVYCVPGNHGRVGKDKSPQSNWDLMAYLILEDWLQQSGIKNIHIEHSETDHLVVTVRGWKFGLVHKIATSAAGARKALGWANSDNIDAIVTGHWHHFELDEDNGLRKFMSGSLKGTDTYAEGLGKGAPPSQLMWGVTENHVSTFIYVVDLRTK